MSIFLLNDGFPSNNLIAGKAKLLGNLKGFAKAASSLLLDLDFSQPTAQLFPSTGGQLNNLIGANPSHLWTFQETGGDYIDAVGSVDLSNNGALQGQKAIGLWDGSSYTGRYAFECLDDSSNNVRAADSAALDYDNTTSFAVLVVFRTINPDFAGGIFSKWLAGVGYELSISGSGVLTFAVDDGTNNASINAFGDHDDGAWHCALAKYDATTGTISIISDLASGSADASTVGDFSNTDVFLLGPWTSTRWLHMQGTYCAVFEGAEAEALDQTAFDAFWQHGQDPTGKLTTATRAGYISVPVGTTSEGPAIGHFGENQLPIGYHSAFEGTGLGLYVNNDTDNLIDYSEDITQWAATNVTVTAAANDAPDGFRSACEVAATANDGTVSRTFTTTESTEYTLSIWLRRTGGSNVSGRLVFYDETSGAELAATAFSALDAWSLCSLTATTNVGQVSSSFRIEIDTSGGGVHAWGAQANLGDGRGAYARTEGAVTTLSLPDYQVAEAVPSPAGRLEASCVFALNDDSIYGVVAATTETADLKWLARDREGNAHLRIADSSGSYAVIAEDAEVHPNGELKTFVVRWDSQEEMPGGGYAAGYLDDTLVDSKATASFTDSGVDRDLYVGRYNAVDSRMNGYIQRVTVYDEPGEEPTPAPVEVDTFRVTTYEVTASDAFSGTSYTLTLNQDLAENYFVQVQGVGNVNIRQYMSDSVCRVGSDPFGTGGLGTTANPNELYLVRDAVNATPDGDWVGTIVVVECLDANSADGFALRDVVVTPLAELGGGEVFGTTAAVANVADAGQVVPFGGRGGGGISTPVGLNTHATKTMGTLISVDSATQITIERQTGWGYVADEATVTTYIVEWGSNWLVQAAEVVLNAGGAGVDSTAEYQTAALATAPAANTVLFATGHDSDSGQGSRSSAMGLTVMMGDGVTVGDNSVAVGRASATDELTALVYSMTHANLSVDWVFQSEIIPSGVSTVDLTVPGANIPDTYGANYTEGRFVIVRSATLVDQSNYNLREQVFGRLTDDTTLTWRAGPTPSYGGDGLAFWASVADFSGI